MIDKKIIVHFTVITFCFAYLVSGALIVLGQFGYRVYSWVESLHTSSSSCSVSNSSPSMRRVTLHAEGVD